MSNKFVYDIEQDQSGFIWFATQNGVSRYDGKDTKFYTYEIDNPYSLRNDWIFNIHSDSEGRLWLAGKSGVHLLLPEIDGFKFFPLPKTTDSAFRIFESAKGEIWFATKTGLAVYDVDSSSINMVTGHDDIEEKSILDIVFDDAQNILFTTADHGLFKYNTTSNNFEPITLESSAAQLPKIQKLTQGTNGYFWLGTEKSGLIKATFSNNSFVELQRLNPNNGFCGQEVKDILIGKDSTIWVATDNGVCELTDNGSQISHHVHEESRTSSLVHNRTSSLFQDSGGVIWVATESGVSYWNANLHLFPHISKKGDFKDLSSDVILSFAHDSKDNLYVGTWDGGLNIIDKHNNVINLNTRPDLASRLTDESVMSLMVDEKDNLWVGTYDGGLLLLRNGNERFETFDYDPENSTGISGNSISKILELRNGNVAIATYGHGLNLYSVNDNSFELIAQNGDEPPLTGAYIVDISEDKYGNVWVASQDKGLSYVNKFTGKIEHFFTDGGHIPELNLYEIFSVTATDSDIWVATKEYGLIRIDLESALNQKYFNYRFYGKNDGLPTSFIYGILADSDGYIWFSHDKGISRLNPRNSTVINFNTSHGLQNSDFNSSAFYKDKQGRLYFGGSNGFNSFSTDEVPINHYKPNLKLTQFSQANEIKPVHSLVQEDGSIQLEYNQTIIDFKFAALDFTRPQDNQYKYKMEGLNEDWVLLGNDNHISFSYLKDGDYQLRVKGSNNDGVWSEEFTVPIEVLPPLWRTWYAYAFYITVVSLITLLFFQYQKEKMRHQLNHERRLHRLAYYDSLTGLPNRQSFHENLERFLGLAKRKSYKAGIMFIDLDRFKRINDTLGHDFGDRVLKVVANRLQEGIRESDMVLPTAKLDDFDHELARFGGDEFTLFLSQLDNPEQTSIITQRIIDAVSEPIKLDDYEVSVTPSIGIAIYPDNGTTVSELMKHADIAMYQAKEDGRRTFKFYSASHNHRALERLQLEEHMRLAISEHQFELHYQPQVDIRQNKITKAEALVRWTHPELGFISPAEFIPIAEESGIIIELGDWILEKACKDANSWRKQGLDCKVSVNVSSLQFKQTALVDKINKALSVSGLPAHMLEIELTESAIMSDVDDNIERLQQIRDMGVTVACDDFGTGYSSLSYLKKFPLNTLKIDRAFVNDINTDENDAAIVKAIMLLADTMNLNVVAEGIETVEQLKVLKQYNCQYIQGYYFSKPLPNKQFVEFLNQGYFEEKFMWELELMAQ